MRMKPKTSIHNVRALLYRRFTDLESAVSRTAYKTSETDLIDDDVTVVHYWAFDVATETFTNIDTDIEILPDGSVFGYNIVDVPDDNTFLQFRNKFFHYKQTSGQQGEWEKTDTFTGTLLAESIKVPEVLIGKYQLNRYYYVGSFDYMQNGASESADTQPIKGLITPLTTMTIRTFDDSIHLDHDDLVVVDKHLYCIESVEITPKWLPKRFNIYFATLNSIL